MSYFQNKYGKKLEKIFDTYGVEIGWFCNYYQVVLLSSRTRIRIKKTGEENIVSSCERAKKILDHIKNYISFVGTRKGFVQTTTAALDWETNIHSDCNLQYVSPTLEIRATPCILGLVTKSKEVFNNREALHDIMLERFVQMEEYYDYFDQKTTDLHRLYNKFSDELDRLSPEFFREFYIKLITTLNDFKPKPAKPDLSYCDED